ncbi:sigma-70 family RNA polymerase sigma factor [Zavarzinella formosa]|uniref:sigma-70 family RNA polymerase sigma factor n=1 Tax=Zavarzinella formosa TaxID=360055 RepID=UPI0002FC927B|nr:sigma-70 family RNA polymerase sigma factor [Zavarzinella formosa]
MNSVKTMIHSDTDRELLQRFRQTRDRDAFGEIVQRYGPVVFGVCRRVLGDFQRAEDAFQQTFLTLARNADTIRKPEALPGWLYSTARRSALATLSPRDRKAPLPAELDSGQRDPLDEISGRDLLRAIEEELAALPEDYRSVILLCGIDGFSIDETASRLGSTNGSIRGLLQRGRELLKQRLVRRGIEIPAALAVVFGTPASVPAATTSAAIEASLAASAIEPAFGAKLFSFFSSKTFMFLFLSGILGFAGWKLFNSIPKLVLPPLNVAKWELTTETPLPKGAIARIGDGRHTLELGKKQIRFANDDKTLVAVGDTDLIAWDVVTGKQLHRTSIDDVPGDVSPKGQWFAQSGRIYETETGKLHWQAFDDRKPDRVRFVGDNRVAMIFHKHQARETLVRQIEVVGKTITEAKFTGFRALPLPGGDRVAVWDRPEDDYDGILADDPRESEIRIHTMKEPQGKPIILNGFRGEPLALEADASGKRLFAATPDGQLSCWNTETGERLYHGPITIPPPNVTRAVADGKTLKYFSRDELSLLNVAPKGDKAIWRGWKNGGLVGVTCHSVDRQKLLWVLEPSSHSAYAVFLFDEPRGRVLVNDQKIDVLDAETGNRLSPANSHYMNRGPSFVSHKMALSGDGRLVAFCNRNIGLYDVEKIMDEQAKPTTTPETSRSKEGANQCGFIPGSNNLVWGTNSNLSVTDIDRGAILDTTDYYLMDSMVQDKPGVAEWVYFDRWNSKWVRLSWNGVSIQKAERPVAKAMKTFGDIDQNLGIIRPQGDNLLTAVISGGQPPVTTVSCWNPFTAEKIWESSFTGNGDFEVTNTLTIDGKKYHPEHKPRKIVVSPDGKILLVLTNTNLVFLNAATGGEIKNLSSGWTKASRVEFENVEFTHDGKQVVLGLSTNHMDNQQLQIRSVNDPDKIIGKIDLGRPGVYSSNGHNLPFALSLDDKLIAVRVGGTSLKIFDLASGAVRFHLPQVTQAYGVSFSANSQRLIAKEANQFTALVWDLEKFAVK